MTPSGSFHGSKRLTWVMSGRSSSTPIHCSTRRARSDSSSMHLGLSGSIAGWMMSTRPIRENGSEQNAPRRSEEKARERSRGETQRRLVELDQGGDGKGLDAHERGREQGEVGEGGQDGGSHEEGDVPREAVHGGRAPRFASAAVIEGASLRRQGEGGGKPGRAHGDERHAPVEGVRQPDHDRGRRHPAQGAADAVDAVRAAEPFRRDRGVEDGIVRRMEHAVTQAEEHRHRQQEPEGGHDPRDRRRSREERHAPQEDTPRAEMVHEEARARLPQPGGREEEAHQEPELDVGDAERLAEEREERRQGELEEVADEMRRADEADDAHITPQAAHRSFCRRPNSAPPCASHRLSTARSPARAGLMQRTAGQGVLSRIVAAWYHRPASARTEEPTGRY